MSEEQEILDLLNQLDSTLQRVEEKQTSNSTAMSLKRRTRQGIMLCHPFSETRLLSWRIPWIVQPKLDGIRAIWSYKEGFLSSTGLPILSVPEIEEVLRIVIGETEYILDGELYIHNSSFQEVSSIVSRQRTLHNDRLKVSYHVFDIKSNQRQVDRLKSLNTLSSSNDKVVVVPSHLIFSLDELWLQAKHIIDSGFEGFIVRNPFGFYREARSTDIMKFKPRKSDKYLIIDSTEEFSIHNEPKGRLGALICQTKGQTFLVGTGFTQIQREELWRQRNSLLNKFVEIKYQELTNREVPRFPVFIEIVESN